MAKIGAATGFWIGIALAALCVGAIGVLMELTLLRRIYRAPELFQLLATFGVVLVVEDAVRWLWGPEDLLSPRAPGFRGTVEILGQRFPQYHLLLMCLGPLVWALLWLLFHRTRWGTLVRAATQDREMTGALGVNQRRLFTGVLFLGCLLAGLGGALQIPNGAVTLTMDLSIVAEAFVVVVIGGMGSVTGAFLAALLVGEISAFGVLLFPQLTLVLTFAVMAVVLTVRPYGLLGRPESQSRAAGPASDPLLRSPRGSVPVVAGVLAVLAVLPWFTGEYAQLVVSEIAILALFAASLHFITSVGGLVSFGHAAYFGVGAYAAGLLVSRMGGSMEAALVAAPLLAAVLALVFGAFCIRLTGVYLAMLTLAFAQILWSIAFQSGWTGGDNGILSVWPSAWASSKSVYYYVIAGAGRDESAGADPCLVRAFWLHVARGTRLGIACRGDRHRCTPATVAGFRHRRRVRGARRRAAHLPQRQRVPYGPVHSAVDRCAGHDPAGRHPDAQRPGDRRGCLSLPPN